MHLEYPTFEGLRLNGQGRMLAYPSLSEFNHTDGSYEMKAPAPPRWIGLYQWEQVAPQDEERLAIRQFFVELALGHTVDLPVDAAPGHNHTARHNSDGHRFGRHTHDLASNSSPRRRLGPSRAEHAHL